MTAVILRPEQFNQHFEDPFFMVTLSCVHKIKNVEYFILKRTTINIDEAPEIEESDTTLLFVSRAVLRDLITYLEQPSPYTARKDLANSLKQAQMQSNSPTSDFSAAACRDILDYELLLHQAHQEIQKRTRDQLRQQPQETTPNNPKPWWKFW